MRILLVSNHAYPASGSHSSGLLPRMLSSGSGQHVHDLLALGLVELGHEVFYRLKGGKTEPLPAGVTFVSKTLPSVDIEHGFDPVMVVEEMPRRGPRVVTCHSGTARWGPRRRMSTGNWIFVSRTQAESYGSERFVRNGIHPSDYLYSERKDEYILFISSMTHHKEKGLYTALDLSRRMQIQLVVAGSSNSDEIIQRVSELCNAYGAKYVGDVRGAQKAELFAYARALLFPTEWYECCPLIIAESLISGTPVIVSNNAACAEMVSPDVGFVCAAERDYMNALNNIDSISTRACRYHALENYHYMRMAEAYLKEYEAEIDRSWNGLEAAQ